MATSGGRAGHGKGSSPAPTVVGQQLIVAHKGIVAGDLQHSAGEPRAAKALFVGRHLRDTEGTEEEHTMGGEEKDEAELTPLQQET